MQCQAQHTDILGEKKRAMGRVTMLLLGLGGEKHFQGPFFTATDHRAVVDTLMCQLASPGRRAVPSPLC